MYTYTDPESDYLDEDCANQLTKQIQCLTVADVDTFLNIVPPISQLIKSIPFSLPILDTIYSRVEQIHGDEEFPRDALLCNELFKQLLWWTALNDIAQMSNVPSSISSGRGLNFIEQSYHRNYTVILKTSFGVHIQTILSIIERECSDVIEKGHKERAFLATCLESLGCHGLVNCSTGLIRLFDAIRFEANNHLEKIRAISIRLKDMHRMKQSTDSVPSCASHQRQMNLHLSEIFERLKQNESMESILNGLLSNRHLSSLLRIVRKRIQSDKMLINVFNYLNKTAPNDFAFDDIDPAIAKVVVAFKNAYDKLLLMIPAESDSGYGNESETGCCSSCSRSASKSRYGCSQRDSLEPLNSSPGQTVFNKNLLLKLPPPAQRHIYTTPLSKPLKRILSKNRKGGSPLVSQLRRFRTTDDFYRSLAEFQQNNKANKLNRRVAKSLSRLNISEYAVSSSEAVSAGNRKNSVVEEEETEVEEKTSGKDQWLLKNSLVPIPDYPDADDYRIHSTNQEIAKVVEQFSSLFHDSRKEVMLALSCLPEFANSEELQSKTFFTVIILTYRSVYGSVARRRSNVYDILNDRVPSEDQNLQLDLALYRHMYRKAKNEYGMVNAKEVTSQIWLTLYDFPSLKTCTRFNKFILECVSIVWDLVAGIDGKLPRLTIDYEGKQFDPEKHQRFQRSSSTSTTIQQFLWPALINTSDNQYLCKAIVIT